MTDNYQQAVKLFERKDYRSTEGILVNLILNGNANTEINYFLAVVKSILGDYIGAEPLYRDIIRLKPDHTEAYYNLALCLHNLQKNDEALIFYKRALELNPFLSEAHNNIAIIYKDMGRYEDAEAEFKQAVKIKPDNDEAKGNLSRISIESNGSIEYKTIVQLIQNKDYKNAETYINNLLDKSPENLYLLKYLGIVYFQLKNYVKALDYFNKILSQKPEDAEINYNIGVCYHYMDDNEKALKYYKKADEIKHDSVEVLNNLGLIYADLKNYSKAEKYYNRALQVNPRYTNSLLNLGGIKLTNEKFEEALEYFNKVLSLSLENKSSEKQISMAYTNIGLAYYRSKNFNESLKYFNLALNYDPENVVTHYNKAEALLIKGNFEEGWREYEWRVHRKEFGKREFKKVFKTNDDLRNKRVLVFAEQGLGDALQFVRYIPLLKEKGCYVIFECEKEMHLLIQGFNGIDEIIERVVTKEPDIEYDFALPLLSLPLYLKAYEPDTAPNKPYLFADENLKNKWAEILNYDSKLKVGIIWAGNPTHTNDRNRSVKLRQLSSLFSIEGTHFYSLQKGIPVIQIKDYQLLISDLSDGIKSFADTAAIIENLDLVITVDTSVAHLAGAMGKETWLLLPYVPDWRWMEEGERTEWYPSMKLYRQPRFKDWDSAFFKLKKDLIKFTKNKKMENINADSSNVPYDRQIIYLGLTSGENYGWGIVSKYFKKELSKKIKVINLDEDTGLIKTGRVNGTVFQILNNKDFSTLYPVIGTKNIGHPVFEYELNDIAIKNAHDFNVILGASSWNVQKLNERKVENTGLLIQGFDPELFYPEERQKNNDLFVIFSGGKFELRKGQDLVLKVIKILQQKYSDIVLINAWYNMWPDTMHSMGESKHIKYAYKGETWKNFMVNLCYINGIDGDKVFTLPIVPNNKLRDLYLSSDIGLFPNRCEGGTNLVMMEYMACAKPVIASYNTGHKDILTKENSLMLERMQEFKIYDKNKKLIADWEEPYIDEIIAKLEYAYYNRDSIKEIGKNAGEFMKRFTWKASAENLLKFI